MLDRAALEFCLADAFHPGCEMTWPVRHATMYSEPYRWRHRDKNHPEPRYGSTLTPQVKSITARFTRNSLLNYTLDGHSVANRYGQLPLGLIALTIHTCPPFGLHGYPIKC